MVHLLKEIIKNFIYKIDSIHWSFSYSGSDRRIDPPLDYITVFEDNFDRALNKDAWRYGPRWGEFHPENLIQRYDTNGEFSYVSPEGLVLEIRNSPKTYRKKELPADLQANSRIPEEFTIPYAIGYVTSIKSWQYGWFEALVKLPKGQSYWPAFWLSGARTWPPEIDIFEAYSNEGDKYAKILFNNILGEARLPNWKIQPNVHYGVVADGTKKMYGSRNIPVADCTERYVQYACHWEKDFIKIYYDGILVLEIRDPKVLKSFNGATDEMIIILNHGAHPDTKNSIDESAMLVRSVRVLQKS